MRYTILLAALALTSLAPAQVQETHRAITIEQAINEAIAANLDLAAQKLNISVAEAGEITARLRPNPVLEVSGQLLDLLGAHFNPGSPVGPNQFNAHTDFPIERGGKRKERISLAREQTSLAELEVREFMRQLISDVQSAFVDVLEAKENLKLAEDNLASVRGVVEINQARLESGDLSQLEFNRSQVAEMQSEAVLKQAQLKLDQSKIRLQKLLGRRTQQPDFDAEGDFRVQPPVDPPDELLRLALLRRPDYLASKQSETRSKADLRLQLANGKADVSVGTEFTRQWAYGASGNTLGLYFSMPLQFSNRNQGEIARAQREINASATRIEALRLQIETEIESAYRQFAHSVSLLASIETGMLAKARSVRDTTEYSYRRGEASLIEYLDAQRAFNETMQMYNEARANYLRSLYQLDAVSGSTVSSL